MLWALVHLRLPVQRMMRNRKEQKKYAIPNATRGPKKTTKSRISGSAAQAELVARAVQESHHPYRRSHQQTTAKRLSIGEVKAAGVEVRTAKTVITKATEAISHIHGRMTPQCGKSCEYIDVRACELTEWQ